MSTKAIKYSTYMKCYASIESRLMAIKTKVEKFATDAQLTPLTPVQLRNLSGYMSECNKKRLEFETIYARMMDCTDEEVSTSDLLKNQEVILDLAIDVSSLIETLVPPDPPTTPHSEASTASQHQIMPNIALPKLSLKTFSGNPSEWINFFNLFETTVHRNTNLSSVIKMQYLLSSLSGEPLNMVKSLNLTAGNYIIAYDLLRGRYHNPRRLLTLHLNALLDLPSLSSGSIKHLRQFINVYFENTQALKALSCDLSGSNPLLSAQLLRKLDTELCKKLESFRTTQDCEPHSLPTAEEIIKFLNHECNISEDATMHNAHTRPNAGHSKATSFSKPVSMVTTENTSSSDHSSRNTLACFACKQSHKVYSCDTLRKLTPHERYKLVKQKNRCVSCLGTHDIRNCQSKNNCKQCNKRHHTLLHFDKTPEVSIPEFRPLPPVNHKAQNVALSSQTLTGQSQGHSTILLGTCLVQLSAPNGRSHVFRALLDSASMTDFVTERAAQLLGSPRQRSDMHISGISQTTAHTRGMLSLTVKTLNNRILATDQQFHILDKITVDLPRSHLTSEVLNKAKRFLLADPTFHVKSGIDVLLGGGIFPHLLTGQTHTLGPNMPIAVGTHLGFILLGNAPCVDNDTPVTSHISTTLVSTLDVDLHDQLQKFWVQQEIPMSSQKSTENSLCDKHFAETHKRDENGRYIVALPFRADAPILGASLKNAENRFYALERKFNMQPQFKAKYIDFMRDYALLGHMIPISNPDLTSPHYFIPHHGIFKQNGVDRKLRTVFDASAKTSSSVSLNDTLLTGQKLQTDICNIILNFRTHNVVFSCDIRQMYRQIRVTEHDQRYQRILWRENPTDALQYYQLTTVTYGMNCSPYLALRTLHQLAADEGHQYPTAAKILLLDSYVDDIISGAPTEEQALQLQQELIALLRKGCFELRKWCSNSKLLLQAVKEEHRETPVFIQESAHPQYSVLGLYWCPETDTFSYKVDIIKEATTKRQILSLIAKLYDPCGFLSPITMWCKAFMQCLWAQGAGWDEPIPPELSEKWRMFATAFNHLANVKIPRVLPLSQAICIQLHGFCDASEVGYAAVVYIRCQLPHDQFIIRQLMAKTRVAPLKRITLPRLELCGAHLLAQLTAYCLSTLNSVQFHSYHLWCDSTVALSWLTTPPFKLKTYVANRVAQTQELVPSHWWHHIRSIDNPADCASRGLLPSDLPDHDLWWLGPQWLKLPANLWPAQTFQPIDPGSNSELKDTPLPVLLEVNLNSTSDNWDLLSRFSSWTRLLRVTAYVLRFVGNLKTPRMKRIGPLAVFELSGAHNYIIRQIQNACFSTDIAALQAQKSPAIKVARLSPFVDKDGLLRVGGRLKKSQLEFNARHPLLMPKRHQVVDLLIDHYHLKHLHAGPQLTQAALSQRYWILSARSRIRTRVRLCLTCFKHRPRNTTPLMADLPTPRVTAAKPFLSTGMDYCGPFPVKIFNLRGNKIVKVYLCIFVCLAVKAVHIEVVTDLTTEAFIAALTRFISRRGLCSDLYSDCGTNFVGADAELKRTLIMLNSSEARELITASTAAHGINFHFNPPSAPHFGGIWESAVKCAKHHLRRTLGDHILTLQEFITLATQIEAMMNSRPITPLSADPNDLHALTPGHFLTGAPLSALPEPPLLDVPTSRLRHFQLVQAIHQRIWRRWQQEYLHTLMQRNKWSKDTANVKINDMVLIQTLTPPLTWPLGRITKVFPGEDGITRVVEVTTATGTLKRPVVKVFPLPHED